MEHLRASVLVAAILSLTAGTVHPAHAADDCATLKGLSLDLTPTDEGYLVPMSVAGTPHLFLLEFEAAYSKFDQAIAEALKLPTKNVPNGLSIADIKGPFTKIVTAPTIMLGPVTRRNVEFLIAPHRDQWGRADGVVGMNVFYGFDIELDLSHNKLGLFLPRDCPFRPYWPFDVVGSSTLKLAPTGGIVLTMEIEGKRIEASIATSNKRTYMPLTAARMLLGIEESNPNLVAAGTRDNGEDMFRYPFKTLSADNVTINNPKIYIYRNKSELCGGVAGGRYRAMQGSDRCFGGGDVELGTDSLSKLRLFFVFKENKVYFTLAEQSPPALAAPTTGLPVPQPTPARGNSTQR